MHEAAPGRAGSLRADRAVKVAEPKHHIEVLVRRAIKTHELVAGQHDTHHTAPSGGQRGAHPRNLANETVLISVLLPIEVNLGPGAGVSRAFG